MSEFYVTFGIKYAREPHPTFAAAHPDGWVTIEAPDEIAARTVAFERLGIYFAFIYYDAPDGCLFPRGELARWTG